MVVLVVMGVCGSGKTTIGRALAEQYGVPFCDADDLHPSSNLDKMTRGIPLNDQDRLPWLQDVRKQLIRWESGECDSVRGVMACSALKQTYRDILSGLNLNYTDPPPTTQPSNQILFIYLQGSYDLLMERLSQRQGHYMPPTLLTSQLTSLEEPCGHDSVTVGISEGVDEVLKKVKCHVEEFLNS